MTSNGHKNDKSLRVGDPRELNGYRVVRRLGRGGMGTVYLAEDPSGRNVAVKLIHPDLADDEDFRLRFAREVESARRVARFSTAGVIDAKLEGDPLYIVSEYVPGPDLDEAVREGGPMSGGTLDSLAMGVAAALTAIHGSGVIHRDLKPANVLLSPVGPKVIDFGIARALDDSGGTITRSSQLMGTPSYMAPELFLGEQATAAADIFAWGCLVTFAGTGSAPFDAPTVPAVLHNISSAEPHLDGLDPGLLELVRSTLDKNPRNRPTSQQLLGRLTGQKEPEVAEVSRTITTSWAPPSSAPVPGRPPEREGPAEQTPTPHNPPSGAQPGAGTPPIGQSTQHYTPPTQHQGPPPPPPQMSGLPRHGGAAHPGSGAQQPLAGHPEAPEQFGGHPATSRPPMPPNPQMYPQSPPRGQSGFTAHSKPGAPNGPGMPPNNRTGSHTPGPTGKKRAWLILGAVAAVMVLVSGVALVLTRPPSVPENTLSLYNTDFASAPDWVSNVYEGEDGLANDGYWAEQRGILLRFDSSGQPSRGEQLQRENETLPDRVLVAADVTVLEGPDQAMFGVRCWGNNGEDDFTAYEALVRYDGQQAEIRRRSEESGGLALSETTDVPGFDPFPTMADDETFSEPYRDFDSSEATLNTLAFSCEYVDEDDEAYMELSLWLNDEFVISAVDENPLPDDAEETEDRRGAGITTRPAPGNDTLIAALFTSFSVHEIRTED